MSQAELEWSIYLEGYRWHLKMALSSFLDAVDSDYATLLDQPKILWNKLFGKIWYGVITCNCNWSSW